MAILIKTSGYTMFYVQINKKIYREKKRNITKQAFCSNLAGKG